MERDVVVMAAIFSVQGISIIISVLSNTWNPEENYTPLTH